jgi:ATP synthase protein I
MGVGQYGPRGFKGGNASRIFSVSRVWTMSDDTRGREDHSAEPTDEAALSARLKRLGERLEHAGASRSDTGPASRSVTDHSGFARGFRLSSELVVGVLVGAGLGWLTDRWLGTVPWGMFVFALLGFTAGVLNVMRQAGVVSGGVPDSTIERRKD